LQENSPSSAVGSATDQCYDDIVIQVRRFNMNHLVEMVREESLVWYAKCIVQAQVQVKELYLYCEEGEIVIIALRVSAMVQIKLGSNF